MLAHPLVLPLQDFLKCINIYFETMETRFTSMKLICKIIGRDVLLYIYSAPWKALLAV